MRITSIAIRNFRKLKASFIELDKKKTVFVGANNSGKTSAMTALRYFLLAPKSLSFKDITLSNWHAIDELGARWEAGVTDEPLRGEFLPAMDIWLDVPVSQIHHVIHLLPTLDWKGGAIGVRLQYDVEDQIRLRADYLLQRSASLMAGKKMSEDGSILRVWPTSLTDFLNKELHRYVSLAAFALDPSAARASVGGNAQFQSLPVGILPLRNSPFDGLIQIDEVSAQRDFSDSGAGSVDGADEGFQRRSSRSLSDQLRVYYDRHLDPSKTPSEQDYDALLAMQVAERSFDARLAQGFKQALTELEGIGYPGIANPKLKISTQLKAMDGLKHGSALQYEVMKSNIVGHAGVSLPEHYAGLGYRNLISMVFMLMGYRDAWMRIGKASITPKHIPPLHLVLVEEPEAHLHAQVQQVFINNAYELLRKHTDLGESEEFCTQLIVSTHSSHVAYEADFSNLRYFRRWLPTVDHDIATTTVVNLSNVFGSDEDTKRFVKRYIKFTHCDLFFADGIIFVEGQAERILVPQFIRSQFKELSRRYITIIELGGSHAHRFAPLVDELGITTLVIADLDAVSAYEITNKAGNKQTVWRSVRPRRGERQKTQNSVIKFWHPKKEHVDELAELESNEHVRRECGAFPLYVAYQKPVIFRGEEVIPRTFEDALVFDNDYVFESLKGSSTTERIQKLIGDNLSGDELADNLFELLKEAEKGAFALDCLLLSEDSSLTAPQYIKEGLSWLQTTLGPIADTNSAEGTENEAKT